MVSKSDEFQPPIQPRLSICNLASLNQSSLSLILYKQPWIGVIASMMTGALILFADFIFCTNSHRIHDGEENQIDPFSSRNS